MDTAELAAGLEDIALQQAAADAAAGKGAAEWAPSMEWLMGSVGPFFNNNRGIGELLLDKLMESGVNTEGVALAGLVNVLQQFSQEYKALGEAVGQNLDRINELSSDNEKLADSIQEVIRQMNVTKDDGGEAPFKEQGAGTPEAGAAAPDAGMPPDAGVPSDMGAMPPDAGVPSDIGAMPPDAGVPSDMGAMPPDAGVPSDMGTVPDMATAPAGQSVVSDARMKRRDYTDAEVDAIMSDIRMKRLVQYASSKARRGKRIGGNIIAACKGDF